MADIPRTGRTVQGVHHHAVAWVVAADGGMLGVANDFDVFDNVRAITVRKRVKKSRNDAGVTKYLVEQFACRAVKRQVSVREAEQSSGRYLYGDVRFEVPSSDLPERPDSRFKVVDADGKEFVVLGADVVTFGSRYRVFAREVAR